jgi:hypothetical protein
MPLGFIDGFCTLLKDMKQNTTFYYSFSKKELSD